MMLPEDRSDVTLDELDRTADESLTSPPEIDVVTPDQVHILSRQELLSYTEVRYELVTFPDRRRADGSIPAVLVRSLTVRERDAFESSLIIGKGKNQRTDTRNIRAKLVALTAMADYNGTRLFTMKDVENIGRVDAELVSRVYDVSSRLSGISEKDLEELAGNFALDQLEDSSSD